LTLGLAAAALFAAAEAAGGLADEMRRPFHAARDDGNLRRFARLFALALFAAGGGTTVLVDGIGRSYAALPVGHVPAGGGLAAVAIAGRLIGAAIELAAPILAAMLVAEIAFGLAGRVAPRLARMILPGTSA